MELAVISESSADEAGLIAFASALNNIQYSSTSLSFRSRGWPAVVNELSAAVARVAWHSRPAALLVVVDGNGSPTALRDPRNRLEIIRAAADRAQSRYSQAGHRVPVILGVAYPAIEAWWLAPQLAEVTEAAWDERGRPGGATYTKETLKNRLYGSVRPSLVLSEHMQREAGARAAAHADLIARRFSFGFEPMLRGLRALGNTTSA